MIPFSFWTWWYLTAILCCYPLLRAWKRPEEVLGFPVIGALMWLYMYEYLSYKIVASHPNLFPDSILTLVQFLPFVCFASFLAGWYLHLGQRPRTKSAAPSYSLRGLWNWGIGLLVVGDAGLYSFSYSESSYATTSAYWYMLFQVAYAGIALCVAVLTLKRRTVETAGLVLFGALTCLLVAPFLLNARRGPTYTAIIAAAFSYLLVRQSSLKLWKVLGTLGAVGMLMIILVHARSYIVRGQSWQTAMQEGTTEAIHEERSTEVADNEFVNHAVKIEANLETGMYQYGTVHLAMLTHWVPRAFWPSKPQRSMGIYPAAMYHFNPGFYTNLGLGGAWGPVADSFDNYWYFCLIFWYFIGWGAAALYKRAIGRDQLNWKMHYLAVLMSSHWFFAQCLTEALVPFMFYQASFWLAFRFSRNSDAATGMRKAVPQGTESLQGGRL
ncbi:MAG: hypothetical protein ACLP9L_27900 [Thermoguttaceae bacterium]